MWAGSSPSSRRCVLGTVVAPLACCRFHACVKELRMSAKRLERRKCPQNFRLIAEAQCSKCGTLYAWDADEEIEEWGELQRCVHLSYVLNSVMCLVISV
mmetsp:Transcript_75948/g.245837  ORF Transcript_75948/g.245837 Transcript_75948/m.245837 type:complete len:99 (+) Transcript_75948:385-681(+)